MQFLRTNTATRVTVGPFIGTDGLTPKTGLTVTSCKLTFSVDTAGVPTLILDTNPTASGGSNDMVHITGDDAGFYDLELAAADVNYFGRARLALTDATNHLPVFHEFMILPAMIYDSIVLGTDRLDTNVTHVNDVAASSVTAIAANLGSAQPINSTGSAGSATVNATVPDTQKVDLNTIKTQAITCSAGVTVPALIASTTNLTAGTIATVTNQLTAAQIATGVWQDTTSGDFTVSSSIGKSLYTSGAAPGASGGIIIVGTNVGAVAFINAAGPAVTIASIGANGTGLVISGNGTSPGFQTTGGATGHGMELIGGASSGNALNATSVAGHGFNVAGGGTNNHGFKISRGGSGGDDLFLTNSDFALLPSALTSDGLMKSDMLRLGGATVKKTYVTWATDNTTSGTAAKAAIEAATAGDWVIIRGGQFTTTATITVPDDVTIECQGGARFYCATDLVAIFTGGNRTCFLDVNAEANGTNGSYPYNFSSKTDWIVKGGKLKGFNDIFIIAFGNGLIEDVDAVAYTDTIANYGGEVRVNNMRSLSTTATAYGGMWVDAAGSLTLANSYVRSAPQSSSAAVTVKGSSRLYLANCKLSTPPGSSGTYAIVVESGSTAEVIGCEFDRTLVNNAGTLLDQDTAATESIAAAASAASAASTAAALPTADENAIALLDKALSGHTTAGTTGKALSNADVATSSVSGGGGSSSTDFDDEPIVPANIWTLVQKSDGWVGDRTITLTSGTTQKFAVDFRNALSVNVRVFDVDDVAIYSGTALGITFGTAGREDSQAKFDISGVTAGNYVIEVDVTDTSTGTHVGRVRLKVVA